MKLRKQYVCKYPFTFTEISKDSQWLCCPSWLPTNIYETEDFKSNWYSEKSEKIRESILDGSYSFCDSVNCPNLSELDAGYVNESTFIKKDNFKTSELSNPKPRVLNMEVDLSCNLKCPSCRPEYINLKDELRGEVDKLIDKIQINLGNDVETLTLCGGAEPFFSKSIYNFMRNFDNKKFPNLKHIHLHTNANLWTESNWERVSNVHPYVKSAEISIDAATEETYNKVRVGGRWSVLLNNINFIKTIKTINRLRFSFVVQKNNYKEMYAFYKMINNLTKGSNKKIEILFNGITDWNSYSKEEFLKQEIHNPSHELHDDFLLELDKIKNLNVQHNFHHLVKKEIQLI